MDYKDKIRKLLALAKSPEPEEAKFALLKARKLMAEHKLSERDLEERNATVIKRAIRETFSEKANSWVVAAYVWHKAAEQKAARAEPRKRKDGMT